MTMPSQSPTSTMERYAAPRSLEEAVRLLAEGTTAVIAGGTDLMVQPHGRWTAAGTLLNVKRIPGLRGVSASGGEIRIGALTTVTDVIEDPLLAERAPVLPATADRFASMQIRNMATIGGNICNASPAADMIIPLLLLDAEVDLVSWSRGKQRTRPVPLGEFFTAPGKTVIRDDELLTCVRFREPADGFVAAFEKTGPRPALEVALVSVGIGGVKTNGALTEARVAFGSVAPTPIRGRQTEAVLEGRPLDEAAAAAAAEAAQAEVSPISDVRGSAWYRGHLVGAFTEKLVRHVAEI